MIGRALAAMVAGALVAASASAPAAAEVRASDASGFTLAYKLTTTKTPAEAYAAIGQVARWWSSAHSYSGDAANMSLRLEAGGCFCERVPASGGSVQHMIVATALPGQLVVMRGALGPLQSMGVDGALTFRPSPAGRGTTIEIGYAVGGHLPDGAAKLAPLVDSVLGAQVARLAKLIG